MAAISLQLARGAFDFQPSAFTVGTNAPAGGDFEFRFNTTDANSNTIPRKDIILALLATIRALETDGIITTQAGL